jgi:hypothetical protein
VSVGVGAGVSAVVPVGSAGAHPTAQQGGVMKAPVKSSRNTGDLSFSCLNELCGVYERAVRKAGALWALGAGEGVSVESAPPLGEGGELAGAPLVGAQSFGEG